MTLPSPCGAMASGVDARPAKSPALLTDRPESADVDAAEARLAEFRVLLLLDKHQRRNRSTLDVRRMAAGPRRAPRHRRPQAAAGLITERLRQGRVWRGEVDDAVGMIRRPILSEAICSISPFEDSTF